jgi:hypothetical protein
MANLMLSVMGAFAEFERSLIRERQREGIASSAAPTKGGKRHRNGRPSWSSGQPMESLNPSSRATTASAGKRCTSTWVPPFRRFTFIPRHALLDPLLAPLRIAISTVVISDTEFKAAAPTDFV